MLDDGFTPDILFEMFNGAQEMLNEMKKQDQMVRFVMNIGKGFQSTARPHLHVMTSRNGLTMLSPEDYRFELNEDGTALTPVGSVIHDSIIRLIEKRRGITGFSSKYMADRKKLDTEIFGLLNKLV
jgi:diadenosine tetraphosphate (Ap4A) HIT family hydrolase